jgi:hypothetical protein
MWLGRLAQQQTGCLKLCVKSPFGDFHRARRLLRFDEEPTEFLAIREKLARDSQYLEAPAVHTSKMPSADDSGTWADWEFIKKNRKPQKVGRKWV